MFQVNGSARCCRNIMLEPLIYCNSPVHSEIRREPGLQQHRRAQFLVERLATDADSVDFKTTVGTNNSGWRRSGLGGGNGCGSYLWWAKAGDKPFKGLGWPAPGSIVVQAIRHHDNHSQVQLARPDSYKRLTRSEIRCEGAPDPLESDQREFVTQSAPVRVLSGGPGSGKTTSLLYAAIEAAPRGVLYISYSNRLAESASAFLHAWLPVGTEICCLPLNRFVDQLSGRRPVTRDHAKRGREAFREEFQRFAAQLGPWRHNLDNPA